MPELDSTTIKTLIETLDNQVTAGSWRQLLELLAPTGVADMLQFQDALSLTRDKVRRLIEQVKACHGSLPPIIDPVQQSTQRAGIRGRTPIIYRLGPSGAAILRMLGNKAAHATQLRGEIEVQHAVLMLDVRLAAQKAGLTVVTDQELPYGNNRCLRPDNQVQLPDGSVALFETEQSAQPAHMRRITESIKNKNAFFSSSRTNKVLADIRMLLNVARGPDWDRTVKIWRQVCDVVAQGQPLPFRLYAMPTGEFNSNPDWGSVPDPARWQELTNRPSQVLATKSERVSAPPQLLRQSPEEDRLVIIALWQHFLENGRAQLPKATQPNPIFFETMQIIYTASHQEQGDALSQAAMPWASIYLLNQYLLMHPALKSDLGRTISRGATVMRWNVTTILHKMQVVIECFLRYHGWRNGGALLATAGTYSYDAINGAGFCITVRIIRPELLMLPGQLIVPSNIDVKQAEEALGWVLLALFAHAERLDLPVCGFW